MGGRRSSERKGVDEFFMSTATLEAAIDTIRSEMDTLYNGTNRLDDPKLLDLSVKLDQLVIEAMKDKI